MAGQSRSAALVGRDEQLAALDRAAADVAGGRGRAVWVEGEPGIGKSALLDAALAGVERAGCQLFRGAAHQLGQRFPLRVVLDCLQVDEDASDPGRAELVALLQGASSGVTAVDPVVPASERLLSLVDTLCAAAPVVLVVDDLQWADEASLAVWDRLSRSVGQLPLLLIAACRSVARRSPLVALRRDVRSGGGLVLTLNPLTSDQSASLVAGLLGASPGPGLRSLADRAGGNPLYLRELVDALVRENRATVHDGVADVATGHVGAPTSLGAAIADRLGFLSPETSETLQFAALLGPEFTVHDLATITGRSPLALVPAVEEGLSSGVLSESGLRLVFRHPLIRQALAEAIPAGLRSALHHQAAQALVASGASMERVAEQLLAAPDAPGVAEGWVRGWLAGVGPRLVYRAPQTALELLQRALDGLSTDDPHWDVLGQLAVTAAWLDGQDAEVERRARQVLAHTRDPALSAQVAWTLAYVLGRTTQTEAAVAVCSEALSDGRLDSTWKTRLRALTAIILVTSGRYEEAEVSGQEALAQAEVLGDGFAAGYALHALSLVRARAWGDDAGSLDCIERGLVAVGNHAETTDLRLLLLTNRSTTLGDLDQLAEALTAAQEAMREVDLTGSRFRRQCQRTFHAQILFLAGQWDEALIELENSDSGDSRYAALRLLAAGLRALIAGHRDDSAAADRALRSVTADDIGPGEGTTHSLLLHRARALVAEWDGNPRLALNELTSVMESTDLNMLARHSLPDLVRLAVTTGDVDIARAATRTAAAKAEEVPMPASIAAAERCRGLLDGNPRLLLSAVGRYRASGRVLELANTLEDAAVLLAEHGDHGAARTALDEALDRYTDLRAEYDIRRATARVRPYGLRRGQRGARRRPTIGWDALTPTELRVAALVAEGRSNPDIATAMFLSRRTVQTHVSHILAKLDARSRIDIAHEAGRHLDAGGMPGQATSTAN